MEASPLAFAYDHAKNASAATEKSDTTVAVNEHTLAAGEFSKAAASTCSQEALRTLHLLEAHHRRLSELIKFDSENPAPEATVTDADLTTIAEKNVSTSAAVAELRAKKEAARKTTTRRTSSSSSVHSQRRMPPREMSSSIASNLASARGIRSSRALSPSVTRTDAPGSMEPPRRTSRPADIQVPGKPSWLPPVTHEQISQVGFGTPLKPEGPAPPSASDEGFSKFYSTFESLINKLSAPLAFAGLPLIAEEDSSQKEPKTGSRSPQKVPHAMSARHTVSSEPELSRYFSRAALRASGRNAPVNDSFYVVPQTGGTAKYSEILGFEAKEKRRLAASAHGENPDMFEDPENGDDFVDAREHPEPSSPNRSRTSGKSGRNVKELENVVEELSLENKTLKDCLDAMSRRLHTFESAAQQSTLALQESIRMFRPTSPAAAPRQGSGGGEEVKKMERRLRALEDKSAADAEKLTRMQKEGEKLQKENEKLKSTLSKYRERWEQLKAGAKTRREAAATGSRDSGPSGAATDASPNVRYMAG